MIIVKDKMSRKYLAGKTVQSFRLVDDMQKARVYPGLGAAKNSINLLFKYYNNIYITKKENFDFEFLKVIIKVDESV